MNTRTDNIAPNPYRALFACSSGVREGVMSRLVPPLVPASEPAVSGSTFTSIGTLSPGIRATRDIAGDGKRA